MLTIVNCGSYMYPMHVFGNETAAAIYKVYILWFFPGQLDWIPCMLHKMSKNKFTIPCIGISWLVFPKTFLLKNFKFQLNIGTCNLIFERTSILMYIYVMKFIFRNECKGIDGFINAVIHVYSRVILTWTNCFCMNTRWGKKICKKFAKLSVEG